MLETGSRSPANQIFQAPERYIIVAVDIDPAAFSATSRAREVMRSLEGEYELREVSAWPIEPLHMHCVVLQIPEGVDRLSVLTKLSHDSRIRLVQPLQTFATRIGDDDDRLVGSGHDHP